MNFDGARNKFRHVVSVLEREFQFCEPKPNSTLIECTSIKYDTTLDDQHNVEHAIDITLKIHIPLRISMFH